MQNSWILLALIAGLASNASNFFSRFLLKNGEDSTVFAWYFEFVRLIVFALIAFFDFKLIITFKSILLLLAMGLSELACVYVYMKMHANSHLSISAIISRTRLIWVPFFAFLLLGERFNLSVYIGMLVLLVGLMMASSPHKLFIDKGIMYAYLSAFLIGINATQMKMNTPFASASVLLIFLTLPTSLIIPLTIKNAQKKITHFFSGQIIAKLAAAIVNILSIYTFTLALKTGPVSIINAIYQATMIFAVLAGIFILGEKEDILRKLLGTAAALVGIIVLSLSGI